MSIVPEITFSRHEGRIFATLDIQPPVTLEARRLPDGGLELDPVSAVDAAVSADLDLDWAALTRRVDEYETALAAARAAGHPTAYEQQR
ncbi:hypothetical protein [Pseudoclavibacter soli]|uniref:hypothetical protein n=1 Tax=Pseudoclavibacter soli TaxID=452623 RepID=UPI0003F9D171|nr:hypothetical protein [Pseudoclavibacter soli]